MGPVHFLKLHSESARGRAERVLWRFLPLCPLPHCIRAAVVWSRRKGPLHILPVSDTDDTWGELGEGGGVGELRQHNTAHGLRPCPGFHSPSVLLENQQ